MQHLSQSIVKARIRFKHTCIVYAKSTDVGASKVCKYLLQQFRYLCSKSMNVQALKMYRFGGSKVDRLCFKSTVVHVPIEKYRLIFLLQK